MSYQHSNLHQDTNTSGGFQSEINVGKLGAFKQPELSPPNDDEVDEEQDLAESQDAESVSEESLDPKSGTKGQVSEPSSQKQQKQIKF